MATPSRSNSLYLYFPPIGMVTFSGSESASRFLRIYENLARNHGWTKTAMVHNIGGHMVPRSAVAVWYSNYVAEWDRLNPPSDGVNVPIVYGNLKLGLLAAFKPKKTYDNLEVQAQQLKLEHCVSVEDNFQRMNRLI